MNVICKTHNKYKGKRKPRCCGGIGCWSCWRIYGMKRNLVFLDEWSITSTADPYTPPEHQKLKLHGFCFDHPRHKDCTEITTSSIVNVKGRIVKTRSGSIYVLGEPTADYIKWLKENNFRVPTDKEPIRQIDNV
jgi:hypothetical protein